MFKKFPSIEQLHSVAKLALKQGRTGDIKYVAKIKLHGTNACVRIEPDGSVHAQKRSGDCTPEHDNAGFAAWLEDKKDFFRVQYGETLTPRYLYGEWAGEGIQKGDAVGKAPKCFYPFMYQRGTLTLLGDEDYPFDDIKPVPIFKEYTVNFFDKEKMDAFVAEVTKDVDAIGECDPFIKELYGIEGPGEGLVFYPEPFDSDYMFKVKTQAHMNNKRLDKAVVSFTPEQVKHIDDFCAKYVTTSRLEQGVTETGEIDIKKTGMYVGWVCKDVLKESKDELGDLEWKPCAAVITRMAREYYFKQLGQL